MTLSSKAASADAEPGMPSENTSAPRLVQPSSTNRSKRLPSPKSRTRAEKVAVESNAIGRETESKGEKASTGAVRSARK